MSEIKDLKPTCVWQNFDALAQVPRPSGHLDKVHQFLLDFTKRAGIEAYVNKIKNVVMKEPAIKSMESRKTVIL